ncbi:phosphonate transport system permease protein [Lipingzhangella halophila]|uniref:Phosphonate transport system permease protein n=1 Tax=Lipingzhangella halophila TaxID=1783352 RepID=A0A7W7REI0_9ACTN|nr:ABC transporter permease subunit [Lipingzhangella halophila]MBB4930528.1 phosphonate transport system permease protein [Lipingzhangella halophila]
MTLRLDAPPSPPAAPAPTREHVSGRKVLLRKLVSLTAVAAMLAWAVHRAFPSGGELVNQDGLALFGDLAATALRPSLDADFLSVVLEAAATTLALALLGSVGALVVGLVGGLVLSDVAWGDAPPWPVRMGRLVLRGALVAVRSVHELVWALFLVTVLGLDPLVAVLALTLPFGAQSAQVFGETFDAVPDAPLRSLRAAGAKRFSALVYALLPATAPLLLSYSFYRFECALRSAVVLGVAGVGGLGFELTVSLQSRNWDEVWTLVAALLVLAGAIELWSNRVRSDVAVVTCADWSVGRERPDEGRAPRGLTRSTRLSLALMVPAISLAWWWVGLSPAGLTSAGTRERGGQLLSDLWPPALPEGGWPVLIGAALDTVTMAVLAMVLAVAITLLVGPWASRPRAGRHGPAASGRKAVWAVARAVLLVLRSIPPTVWAIIALLGFFPGILPGALALGLYTGGILGRLVAEAWETMNLKPRESLRDAGVPRAAAAVVSMTPPSANHLVTYTLYRFEICVRDTAIVGVVGAAGLGRLLNERLAAFDFPVVASVLLASLLVSIAVETLGRRVRRALRA